MEVFAHRRHEGAGHTLALKAQHHDDICVFQAFFHSVVNLDTHISDTSRQQCRRSDDTNTCAECIEKQDVGTRNTRVKYIAANRNNEVSDIAFGATDGERIKQRLRRMLMSTVTRIDDCTADFLCEQCRSTCRSMANDQNIGLHGVERHGSIDQRFAFFDRRIADGHVHHVSTQPFSGEFERRLCSRRCFKEEVDLCATAQHGLFLFWLSRNSDFLIGKIKKAKNVQGR